MKLNSLKVTSIEEAGLLVRLSIACLSDRLMLFRIVGSSHLIVEGSNLQEDDKVKVTDKLSFPTSMDMQTLVPSAFQENGANSQYELAAILIHKGRGAHQGHYGPPPPPLHRRIPFFWQRTLIISYERSCLGSSVLLATPLLGN
jgi:hypothetical protein